MFPSLLPLSFYKAFAVQKLKTDQGWWCLTIYQSFPTNNFHGITMQYNETTYDYILYGMLFYKSSLQIYRNIALKDMIYHFKEADNR